VLRGVIHKQSKNCPKISRPTQNPSRQKGDKKQVPHSGPPPQPHLVMKLRYIKSYSAALILSARRYRDVQHHPGPVQLWCLDCKMSTHYKSAPCKSRVSRGGNCRVRTPTPSHVKIPRDIVCAGQVSSQKCSFGDGVLILCLFIRGVSGKQRYKGLKHVQH
jgi:hypothetical protein